MQSERRVGRRSRCPAGPPMRPGFVVSATTIGPANGRRSHRPRMVVRSRRRRPDRGEPAPSRGGAAQWDRPGQVRRCGPRGSVAACSRCRRGGGKPTDERRGRHCARLGDLGLALRLQHRCHLLGPIAAHRGVQPHRGLEAGGRRQHPARRHRRGVGVQLAIRPVRPARHAVDAGGAVHRRRAVVCRRAGCRGAVAGKAGLGLRRRRGDPDGPDVCRRALAVGLPGAVGAVLPDRHRGGHPRR